ncbi:MAG: hypothetical protein CVT47_03050 [Thermoplasmata archaeon HGW-Thermoplasmata-2]|nr:MAG: hypothetical protein CVT47_03050 [Thermoplasmata archaeon HGW-Thermoplasmata-2]
MIEILEKVLPYITGLLTLPWILVGFVATLILLRFVDESRINRIMKRIGTILLFLFVPLLLFRIFLGVDFGGEEIKFSLVVFGILPFMYLLAYLFAGYSAKRLGLEGAQREDFVKTAFTNQGRSAAFVGGAMLAIVEWRVFSAIYMCLVGIWLFAIIPYILSVMHRKRGKGLKTSTLPWHLKIYPWYLLSFVAAAVVLHRNLGIKLSDFGDMGIVLKFFTALTIPAALYYVGAGIRPRDFKIDEMKKLLGFNRGADSKDAAKGEDHWPLTRSIFFLTMVLTPLIISLFFGALLLLNLIPKEWFAVIILNSILPITSTNMFLVPYGIDRKATALSVTWTTVVSVPLLVLLINIFSIYF